MDLCIYIFDQGDAREMVDSQRPRPQLLQSIFDRPSAPAMH
jgi:hypothetical protein